MKTRRNAHTFKQKGYSLLILIFALAILAIFITMTASNKHVVLQRDLEADFIQRGNSIAEALARYNNGGRLAPLNPGGLFVNKLEDLTKGVSLNGRMFYFVRPSATKDPVNKNQEWKAVRVGDPIVRQFLQEWAAYYRQAIPVNYQILTSSVDFEDDDEEDEDEEGTLPPNNNNPTEGKNLPGKDSSELLPIIGVTSKSHQQAYIRQNGQDKKYNEFLFMYMPPPPVVPIITGREPINPNQ